MDELSPPALPLSGTVPDSMHFTYPYASPYGQASSVNAEVHHLKAQIVELNKFCADANIKRKKEVSELRKELHMMSGLVEDVKRMKKELAAFKSDNLSQSNTNQVIAEANTASSVAKVINLNFKFPHYFQKHFLHMSTPALEELDWFTISS